MNWTITYILSQVFTIIMYIFIAITYYLKDRKKVILFNFLGLISIGIAFFLLKAWSGFAINIVAMIRNIIFLIDENKNGNREKINKFNILILTVLYIISIISAVLTYEGFFSLFSVFSTMLYTYSIWQKNNRIYKFCGMPVGILWIIYNIYIKCIFGVILEFILLLFATFGYLLDKRKDKEII